MAWRSSGATNDEMVDNLKRFGIISSLAVEQGFRQVDRRHFVPQTELRLAHSDQPLKVGNLHISAPHIYGSVLEAMELDQSTSSSSSLSVLNVGSGTGYFSCLLASIAGPTSVHYGVEISQNAIQHCHESVARWKRDNPTAAANNNMTFFKGNALCIDPNRGEARLGFDRIYIGAAVDKRHVLRLQRLLKPGGILVGPVDDELLKITKHRCASMDSMGDESFTSELLAGVRFSSLIHNPDDKVITIPARIWSPSLHAHYPESFRASCKALMLCSRAELVQAVPPAPPQPTTATNVAAMLPTAIWTEILSYTHKDWFQAPQSEVEQLRHQLEEERAKTRLANQARLEAESRCRVAERERNVYRLLSTTARGRRQGGDDTNNNLMSSLLDLVHQLQQQQQNPDDDMDDDDDDDDDDPIEAIAATANSLVVVNNLAAVLGVGRQSEDDDDDDDDDDSSMDEESTTTTTNMDVQQQHQPLVAST